MKTVYLTSKDSYSHLTTCNELLTTAALAAAATTTTMKKALRETQKLRAGCSKVQPKILGPPQTLFLEERDGQNLISWRWSLPLPTNTVW